MFNILKKYFTLNFTLHLYNLDEVLDGTTLLVSGLLNRDIA